MSKSMKPREARVQHLTYYVVQSYSAVKGAGAKIKADDPREARNHEHAMLLFDRLKQHKAGVVAFHRTGSPATGEWEDATIIARSGTLPAEVDDMIDETALDPWELEQHQLGTG